MMFLYNILITLYFILTLPYYAVQVARREKYRVGLKQRLGFYPHSVRRRLGGGRRVWFHAVSVGEVLAVMPLVKRVHAELPELQILLSTVTLTGQRVAGEKIGDAGVVIYFPLDMSFAVRRALRLISPELIVLVETEIWPNFICAAAEKRIPIAIINGRISDRSFPGYRCARSFLKRFLSRVAIFSMQTDLDARRIQAIGAPSEKIAITGNMKFDCGITPGDEQARLTIISSLGLSPRQDVIVAGSTHRGEEEIVLDAYRAVRSAGGEPALIIVPRHPERAAEVKALAEARGERCVLRSCMSRGEALPPRAVLIVDTIGELVDIYRAATVVFVGKSLVAGGGQNIIEPASMGKAVLFGPSMHNFREAAELLLKNKGAIQVGNARALQEALTFLLRDRDARESMGRRAAESMSLSRGATRRNLEIIKKLLVKSAD
ncbi:MAG: 3-deoxy-D-manno-octulosonic acid transferase [Candidatus Aureabacteria bacterium]|nr:3-deoxy-D-manno-octulosonic acid transferase [Candidatus Auribacterota bacterium]